MGDKELILVIDDEPDICELLSVNLQKEGYDVITTNSGKDALELLEKHNFSGIVLDIMLPDLDGYEVCKKIKSKPEFTHIPVMMLSAKSEEFDVVLGLEIGADDYLTKPFSPRVLRARMKALLRLAQVSSEAEIPSNHVTRVHQISIDSKKHEVIVEDELVPLTSTEFKVLSLLAKRPGWVFSRAHIVDSINGEDYAVTERSVDVQIVALRRKLKDAGSLIETVRGVGYRIKER